LTILLGDKGLKTSRPKQDYDSWVSTLRPIQRSTKSETKTKARSPPRQSKTVSFETTHLWWKAYHYVRSQNRDRFTFPDLSIHSVSSSTAALSIRL